MIFTNPLVLFALVFLPVLWWLLRFLPPKPLKEIFPPLVLMRGLKETQKTAHTTPWWLIFLRILLVLCLILGLAEPFRHLTVATTQAPLVLVIDDGFAAAKNFATLQQKGEALIDEAGLQGRKVAVISTTRPAQNVLFTTPIEAKKQLQALEPVSYAPQMAQVNRLYDKENETIHLSDGVAYDPPLLATRRLAQGLMPMSFIRSFERTAHGVRVSFLHTQAQAQNYKLQLQDEKGREILVHEFSAQGFESETDIELPREILQAVAKLVVLGEGHVGALHLVDQRQTRKAIALITGQADVGQPLLSSLFYLERALNGLADVTVYKEATHEALRAAIEAQNSALILADVGSLGAETNAQLENFMQQGGIVVRFASPRLVNDRSLPVKLIQNTRQLGGAMSWTSARKIAPFPVNSLFYGLEVPQDLHVFRQVLAEPEGDLAAKTHASLEDGTPLITLEKRGLGFAILFHVSSHAAWSDLPLSGVFTQMLARITALAGRKQVDLGTVQEVPLPPFKIFNGRAEIADLEAKPLPSFTFETSSPSHPVGLYGTQEYAASVNVFNHKTGLKMHEDGESYQQDKSMRLTPYFLAAAFFLFILDSLVMLRFARVFIFFGFFCGALLGPMPLKAQEKGEMRLAFVQNGSSDDKITLAALQGLTRYIANRTTLEPEEPRPLSLEQDELNLYPLIFWAIQPQTPRPSAKALMKLEAYLKNGGLLVIDTADAYLLDGVTPATRAMRNILNLLDIPPLSPVPENHVLGRSYYLLNQFPGRQTRGTTWIEALSPQKEEDRPARASDSVSPIIITNQDWLGAWAIDANGRPLLPLEGAPRQRDMAFRVGVNIVLYALTGNYKSDQVHVPDLLARLKERRP